MPEDRAPRVSIVIPAFNAAASLPAAVASAQAQTMADFEILVVDDASTDETLPLARRLAAADPRVVVIEAARNRGPAGARNLGLAAARGAWIALLDADDAFEPSRLEELLRLAEERQADLIADNLLLDDGAGPAAPMLPTGDSAHCALISAADFLLGNLPDPAQPRRSYGFLKPLIARAFLQRHSLRYDENLRFAEDFAFYLDCFAAGARFCLVPRPLYRYRLRADSLTAQHSTEDLRRLQAVDRRLAEDGRLLAQPGYAAALRRHRRSVDQRLQWRVVIDEVKHGAWLRALAAGLTGWHVFVHVCGKLAIEAWRRLGPRRWTGRASAVET